MPPTPNCRLKDLQGFPEIDPNLNWTYFLNSPDPFTDPALVNLNAFQKLMIIRLLRPDGLQLAIESFVQEILGPKFIEQGHFDLIKCYEESTNLSPLLFIMTTKMDNPIARILQLANALKMDHERVFIHSMSDAGAQDLVKFIEKNFKLPHWIVIENVHGSLTGLNTLATFLEQVTGDSLHPDFRLWITTQPIEGVPKSLLTRSVKMIDAHKDGLRGLVNRGLNSEFPCKTRLIETSPQKALFQSFIPALCLLHGVLRQRHKFNPRGWTFNYEFSESDLQLSFNVLFDILNAEVDESQLERAIYLIGESVYGGQVSDPMDKNILDELVKEFLDIATIKSTKYKGIIADLSRHTDATVLGLHGDLVVEVNCREMEVNFKKLLKIQDRLDLMEADTLNNHQLALKRIEEISGGFPKPLDMQKVAEKIHPEESILKNVLFEEFRLYNQLHQLIFRHVEDLRQHLLGRWLIEIIIL